MKKDRKKDKENMLKSMKFETDEDVELFEISIYNMVDEDDISCLYDLVEGYDSNNENADMGTTLDSVIFDAWIHYSDKEYIKTMSKAIFNLRGKEDEHAEYFLDMFIRRDENRVIYLEILKDLTKEELDYHIYLMRNLIKDEIMYNNEEVMVGRLMDDLSVTECLRSEK